MIDDVLDKKIRLMQAKMMQTENKPISYSKVSNMIYKIQ